MQIRIATCSAALLVGLSAASAQDRAQSFYGPQLKFSDVFGRAVAVEINGRRIADPTLSQAAAAGGVAGDAVSQLSASVAPGTMACKDLSSLKLPWVTIRSAKEMAAAEDVPAYCQLIGVVDKEITFEVDLPAQWNGKFIMGGGGGFLGNLQNGIKTPALMRGYATAATDTGHLQPADGGGSWALHDPERLVNFGHRGTHLAQANAKLVIQAFYKKRISHAYYFGSSGSGRVAMMEAERYPADFEGIVAACPAFSWTKLNVIETGWTQQTMFPKAADQFQFHPAIAPAKVKLLDQAVYDKCDAADGLKDGIITNPLACKFDPRRDLPVCKAGEDKPECFTDVEVGAITRLHDGPSNAQGQIWPGFAYGGENVPGMWNSPPGGGNGYVIGEPVKPGTPYASRHYLLTNETARYLVYGNPDYDLHSFNFDTDLAGLEPAHNVIDADNPDLSAFRARGGKLIIGQGWADWAVDGLAVKSFYDEIAAKMGGVQKTAGFARLFMLPGVGHCLAADPARKTPNNIDYLTPLENWVEKSEPPQNIIATHIAGERTGGAMSMPIKGTVDRTRPICAYPAIAAYKGTGSIDEAANFVCRAPKS